jgi:uncharacterized RDD family membrane protein YckC
VRTAAPVDVAIGAAVVTGRLGLAAARVAFLPARMLLGGRGDGLAAVGRDAVERGRELVAAAAEDAAASPAVARAVDAALAGPLPEDVARSLAERQVVERLVASPELARAVADALRGPELERMLASEELERAVAQVVSSPAVRAALTAQTSSFAGELAESVRRRTAAADDAAATGVRRRLGRPAAGGGPYGGLLTRALALGLDLGIVAAAVTVGGALLGLVASLVGDLRPAWLVAVLLSAAGMLAAGGYLLFFWTITGQTPGMRAFGLRVVAADGRPPRFRRACVRLVGLILAIVPLFAGFLPVLSDERRRGLHDRLARTVVLRSGSPPVA